MNLTHRYSRRPVPQGGFVRDLSVSHGPVRLTVPATVRIIGVCGCRFGPHEIQRDSARMARPFTDAPSGTPVRRSGKIQFMRTFVASAKSANSRWHVIDANGQVLGRVATLAARLLQGKHKADLHPVHRHR